MNPLIPSNNIRCLSPDFVRYEIEDLVYLAFTQNSEETDLPSYYFRCIHTHCRREHCMRAERYLIWRWKATHLLISRAWERRDKLLQRGSRESENLYHELGRRENNENDRNEREMRYCYVRLYCTYNKTTDDLKVEGTEYLITWANCIEIKTCSRKI